MASIKFETLKSVFYTYLLDNGKLKEEDMLKTDETNISIFKYAKEFKDYLKNEMSGEINIESKSVSEIISMVISGKELVLSEELENALENAELEENIESESDEEISESDEEDTDELYDSEDIDESVTDEITGESGEELPETSKEDIDEPETDKELIEEDGEIAEDGSESEEVTAETEEEDSSLIPEDNILIDIFNELLLDEEFYRALDTDGNSEISKEEQIAFINAIKNFDGVEDDISFEDLLDSATAITEGKLLFESKDSESEDDIPSDTISSPEDITEVDDTTSSDEEIPEVADTTTNTPVSNGTGSDYSSYTPTYNTPSDTKSEEDTTPKTLDKMSKYELQNELLKAQVDLDEKQKKLDSIYDDSDSTLSALKKKEEDAYNAYQKELNEVQPKMAEDLGKIVAEISANDLEISNQERSIAELEQLISNLNCQHDSIINNSTTETQQEQAKEIKAKIEEEQAKLAEYKNNLENVLLPKREELKNQKDKLEEEIAEKYPQIAEYMKAYNDAKSEYGTKKAQMITDAKSDVDSANSRVQEINQAIYKVENKDKELKLGQTTEDLFDDNITGYTTKTLNYNGRNYYALVPEGIDLNEELPLLIYLHGYGERGSNIAKLNDDRMYLALQEMAKDPNYKNFKGIVLFPQSHSNACWNDKNELGALDGLVSDFINNSGYNINKDKVSLCGFSNGGGGVGLYYNYSGRTVDIHRVGVFAGYFVDELYGMFNSNVPIRVYTGTSDSNISPDRYHQLANKLGIKGKNNVLLDGVGHGGTPGNAIFRDGYEEEKNGCSDFFEYIWGNELYEYNMV